MAQIFFKEELQRLLASIDSLICIFSMESSKLLRSFEMKILFCGGEAAAKKIESRRPTLLVFEEGWLRAKTKGTRHKNYKSFDSIEIPMSKFYFDIQGNNHCKQKSLWFLFT